MNRRSFMKLIGASIISPSLPKPDNFMLYKGIRMYYNTTFDEGMIHAWESIREKAMKAIFAKHPIYEHIERNYS